MLSSAQEGAAPGAGRGWARPEKDSWERAHRASASRECWGRGCLHQRPSCTTLRGSLLPAKPLPPHSATKAFPWAPLCPGAPMWTLSGAGPLPRAPQSWPSGIFNSLPDRMVWVLLSPLYRGESWGSRGTGLSQGHTARGWRGCRYLNLETVCTATPSHASVKTLMALRPSASTRFTLTDTRTCDQCSQGSCLGVGDRVESSLRVWTPPV